VVEKTIKPMEIKRDHSEELKPYLDAALVSVEKGNYVVFQREFKFNNKKSKQLISIPKFSKLSHFALKLSLD
jgi:hypothetical protein